MLQSIVLALLLLAIVLPIGIFFIGERKTTRFKKMLTVNIVSFFSVLIVCTVVIFANSVYAATPSSSSAITDQGLKFLAAAFSTGLATVGAGIATGAAASAALGALSENDSIMGRALIFVALAEGIAIYGLLISFMILNQ